MKEERPEMTFDTFDSGRSTRDELGDVQFRK